MFQLILRFVNHIPNIIYVDAITIIDDGFAGIKHAFISFQTKDLVDLKYIRFFDLVQMLHEKSLVSPWPSSFYGYINIDWQVLT